jgi:hypothetical protein
MSGLGRLLGIGSLDENFIEGLLDDLDDLGIQYPDMSDVDLTDANEVIYSLMYEISSAFLSDFSLYVITNDIDFDLDNFQIDIRPNCLASEYEISYNDEYASDGCIDTYVAGDSEKAFKELLKEFGVEVEDDE